MQYKLIACDLDGTLVSTDLSLSEQNRRAIRAFREKGIIFAPCTGRTLSEMRDTVNNPSIRYYIYSNGAAIWDKEKDETVFCGFSKERAETLVETLREFDCFIILHHRGETYVDIELTDENVKKYNVGLNVRELVRDFANRTDDLSGTVRESDGTESFAVLFRTREDTERCRSRLLMYDDVSVVDGWSCNLEIFPSNTSKGRALEILAEKLGIPLSEVIAIGDSDNDISMIKVAGLGLAVSNACSALKSVADEIACSNDEGVVSYILDRYFDK